MDPNACLREILDMVREVLDFGEWDAAYIPSSQMTYELAEKVSDLDTWLSRGGILPLRWTASRKELP